MPNLDLPALIICGCLLTALRRPARAAGTFSLEFVVLLTVSQVFGVAWAVVSGLVIVAFAQILRRADWLRALFNVAQCAVSVAAAGSVYILLGGNFPARFIAERWPYGPGAFVDVGLFLVASSVYFIANGALVTAAVALSTGKRFGDVWHANHRGILGYDFFSSLLTLIVIWFFAKSDQLLGSGVFGLVLAVPPIAVMRQVYGMYRALEESGQELLRVMVKSIEARDPYTSGHSMRVRELSGAIAEEMGCSADITEKVETAALLHDVGKIHEQFAPLLRKEAPLTPAEFAMMKTHAERSAELVGTISRFRGFIHDSVRHHHERWDGLGYPDGIAGEQIPLGARIIMVADTIDAMTSDRPYRSRLSVDGVLAELARCRGTQFDPAIIDRVVRSARVARLIAEPHRPSSADAAWPPVAAPEQKRRRWPSPRLTA